MNLKNYISLRYLRVALVGMSIIGSAALVEAARGKAELPKEELHNLNRVMASADVYMRDKTTELDSLKNIFLTLPSSEIEARSRAAVKISQTYLPMRADSALRYSELAIRLSQQSGNKLDEFNSRIARINALSTAGIFTRAVAEFNVVEPMVADRAMKISYWLAGRKMYGYMRSYVEGERQFFNDYTTRYMQYDDSLIQHLPVSDPTRTFYVAERLVQRGQNEDARKMLEEMCKSLPEESNLYGMAAFQLGIVSRNEGDPTGYASYLAKAAISDIKGCVKDGYALPALAEWLYQQGELSDAFKYINFALEDAMEGNVRMRTVSIASLLPMIDEAYKEKINASRDELMIYFLLVTFLFIVSVVLCVILMRMIKRSRRNAKKLADTAHLQESYIGHFIGLCSTYAIRLESLQKLVVRKISSGQGDDLLRLIKTGKYADELNDDFYKTFDVALLDIYPDFIENINSLLKPDEQVELKKSGELPPELRIYGFVRLGVEESQRIAQILNYSVSTVYAYRNRMRNRAIDRDNFDANVMNLGKKNVDPELF
ncbi:MAG: hypothetical protein HDS25_01340 [Bacteroides sp.]|nr:hypothetical protein [Bacteroidales bacterium]MBD5294950.1 hypothetical protein [Bacteroides sp.]